jgi:spore protease
MKHKIDLSKYNIRTDLVMDNVSDIKNSKSQNKIYDNIKITNITLNKKDAELISKKPGTYITIEFEDATDETNISNLTKVVTKELKALFKRMKIKNIDTCLIIGLGNQESTPDSLGPIVANQIIVTRHLFLLNDVDENYRSVASFIPNVTGTTGIETADLIESITKQINPDFIIVIDALASSSIERVNKTIQISNTGIQPGSGIGNSRKEISFETLNIPVIAIGIPTVVDAVSVVSDTIRYMQKHYAFNKKFVDNPLSRLVSGYKINYLKKEIEITNDDKTSLLGFVGSLNEAEIRQLIFEVLTPIGYNLMVTPKEIDFVIKKLGKILSDSINNSLHKKKTIK